MSESRVSNPFLTWEWVSAWLESFRAGIQPWLVVVREGNGNFVGVAPLVRRIGIRRRVPLREIAFVGTGLVAADHLDLITLPGYERAVASEVLKSLRRTRLRFDLLNLAGTRPDSPLITALQDEPWGRQRLLAHEPCPYIALPRTWEEYLAGRERDLRRGLERRKRRLDEHFDTVLYRRVRDESALEAAMGSLIHLHVAGFASRSASAFPDRGAESFHHLVARHFLRAGWLRFYLLTVDGVDVAADYGFAYGDRWWSYLSGYDRAFSRYSVGSQLLAHTIREAIGEGLGEFDFLRGDEDYKFDWADRVRHDVNLTVPARLDGRLLIALHQLPPRTRGPLAEHPDRA
ncbi:MAG: GNAT family N-acetyltransferase [Nitriliruptorales bacterium]